MLSDFIDAFLVRALLFLGFLSAAKILSDLVGAIRKYLLRTGFDLTQRYGKGSYVVITGPAPGGIGATFAREFALRGFNLVLIGRTVSKMKETADKLKAEFKGLHVVEVEADLGRSMEPNFFEGIADRLKDLDISVLVHNAGAVVFRPQFDQVPLETNRSLIAGNGVPSILLTQALLPKLKQHQGRTAILFMSSALGQTGIASAAVCGAIKSLLVTFAEAIAYEFREKIDVLVATPFQIHSNITLEPADGFSIITSETFVHSVLRDLGTDTVTSGHWPHALQKLLLIDWLPKNLLHKIFSSTTEAKLKKGA